MDNKEIETPSTGKSDPPRVRTVVVRKLSWVWYGSWFLWRDLLTI
jgi:hypothetical protein